MRLPEWLREWTYNPLKVTQRTLDLHATIGLRLVKIGLAGHLSDDSAPHDQAKCAKKGGLR